MKNTNVLIQLSVIFSLSLLFSCGQKKSENEVSVNPSTLKMEKGHHSYARIDEVRTKHLHLDLDVNFENNTIYAVARHQVINNNADTAIFDIKYLDIQKVTLGKDTEIETDYVIGENDLTFGAPLMIPIDSTTEYINIYYKTTDKTEALDWLTPELTEGKKYPFLYSQGQTILTRSWIPIQDTPSNRITYSADVKVPSNFLALMSAENPTSNNDKGEYHFEMKQAIPAYLIALAVGKIEYRKLGENCGVYSEPELIEASAKELEDLPQMISAAESLYGSYRWGQYDVIVLPYSFPFGGMENPRLTFANPTLITGDKSLVTVIAHELAHSWSGNLVTNESWEDFWLNEGFTVYFENRIMEKLYGKDIANILAVIEFQELEKTLKKIDKNDTKLKLNLSKRNPDDGLTDISYIKGAYFLRTLEETVGRTKFDKFLNEYFNFYAFKTATTESFITFLDKHLLKPNNINFNTDEWVYQQGLPENCIKIESKRLDKIGELAKNVVKNPKILKKYKREEFITQEWMSFIRQLPQYTEPKTMKTIDEYLSLKDCGNSEIMCEWYNLAIKSGYTLVRKDMEKFISKTGRLKYLEPIYEALATSKYDSDKNLAKSFFKNYKNNYHPVARLAIADIVK